LTDQKILLEVGKKRGMLISGAAGDSLSHLRRVLSLATLNREAGHGTH
jgi:hypothetical protein